MQLDFYTKANLSYPLSLQLDCNQGNYSVVKITNLFLQCTQLVAISGIHLIIPCVQPYYHYNVLITNKSTKCILQRTPCSTLYCSLGFNSGPTELLVLLEPSKPHRPEWGSHKIHSNDHRGGKWEESSTV